MIPEGVIEIRKELCSICADKASDPCARCNHGKWQEYRRSDCAQHRLGDRVERAIGRIPGIKNLPCYDEAGKLKAGTPCGKARDRLNRGERIIPTVIKRIKGE